MQPDARALVPVLIVLACAAAMVVVAATPFGIGVSPDSVAYLSAADAIRAGRGAMTMTGDGWRPLTHYPPLFPVAAAIVSVRALHVVLLAVFIVLASLLVFRASGGSVVAAALTGLVLLASDDLVGAYCMAWSEPLFFALLLGFVWALGDYLLHPRMQTLLLAAVFAAAAVLTRYAAVSVIATGVLAILFSGAAALRSRMRHASIFAALAAAPIALWLVRNTVSGGSATARPLVLHPLPYGVYLGGAQTLWGFLTQGWNWIVLDRIPRNLQALAAAVFVMFVLIAGLAARRSGDRIAPLIALFAIVHMAGLIAAGAVQDFIVFDERHLLFLFVCTAMLLVVLLTRWTAGRRAARVAIAVLLLVYAAVGARSVMAFVRNAREDGLGYNSASWRESPLVARLRQLPATTPIRSNADDAVYFLTGRAVAALPMKYDPVSTLANPRYAEELKTVGGDGVVVWFSTVPWRRYAPTREELLAVPHLEEIARERDGSLFRAR